MFIVTRGDLHGWVITTKEKARESIGIIVENKKIYRLENGVSKINIEP